MTAGSGFVPVVDDYLVNRLAAVPRPRDGHRVRAVTNRLQALKAIELPSFRGRVGYAASDQPQRLTLSPPHPQLLLFLQGSPPQLARVAAYRVSTAESGARRIRVHSWSVKSFLDVWSPPTRGQQPNQKRPCPVCRLVAIRSRSRQD